VAKIVENNARVEKSAMLKSNLRTSFIGFSGYMFPNVISWRRLSPDAVMVK
jgi:hypothetical protein